MKTSGYDGNEGRRIALSGRGYRRSSNSFSINGGTVSSYMDSRYKNAEKPPAVNDKKEKGRRKKYDKRSPLAIGRAAEAVCHLILGAFALFCVMPFMLSVIISFTTEKSIFDNGYSFIPDSVTLKAYEYVAKLGRAVGRPFFNSWLVTVVGTVITMTVTCLYAYALTRKEFRFRKFFTWWCFFPMLFGGGIAPTYVVCKQMLGLTDSYSAVIIPMLLNSANIILLKTFIKESIPRDLIDAATMDGCGEYGTLWHVVLPLAKPGFATVALITAMGYYNEWFTPMLYVRDAGHKGIQQVLMDIQRTMESMVKFHNYKIRQEIPHKALKFALVTLVVLPVMIICFCFQKYLIPSVRVGRIKE